MKTAGFQEGSAARIRIPAISRLLIRGLPGR